ncbi:MAG TPA: DUF6714 family protein [Dehalococcoidia bacterium]|nr:DUF6714 family protein [Dehalococcoidia bacterium]
MGDDEILAVMRDAFAAPRPEHFTNFQHCCECAEHDATLMSRDIDTLTQDDVGMQSWDPICFATEEAFAYYLPALARLALGPEHPQWGWYGEQLIRHLEMDGARNRRWTHCSPVQRRAVARLLEHISDTRRDLVRAYDLEPELLRAWEAWADAGEA